MQPHSLFDANGHRKYLTPDERDRFARAAADFTKQQRIFGLMLYYTGCRVSEGLNIEIRHIDTAAQCVTLGTLKQRRSDVYRQVPLSPSFMQNLDDVFDIRAQQKKSNKVQQRKLWTWTRQHGHHVITNMMKKAELSGIHATPKGLRHGFAIACIDKGIPLNMIQKWMGHALISTTAIYANALGAEERKLAARLWE